MSIREKAPVYDIRRRISVVDSTPSAAAPPARPAPDESTVKKYARLIHQVLTEKESRLLSLIVQGCSLEDLCNALSTDPDALRSTWLRLRQKMVETLDQGYASSDLKRRFLRVLSGPWFVLGGCW